MAEITPTPAAGTWLRVDSMEIQDSAPRAGTWLRILPALGPGGPRAGTWLRIDASGPVGGGWRIGKIGLG